MSLCFIASIPCVYAPGLYNAAEIRQQNWTREELIEHYFHAGYTAAEIIGYLCLRHDIILSLRHLRRILRRLALLRRVHSPLEDVVVAVQNILRESGSLLGYRFMWRLLTSRYHLHVSQNTVRIILQVLDPDGVQARTNRRFRRRSYINNGPNYMIHVDGWDKLKQFGIAVHAAVDGFSRRVLWLKVGPSNKNPKNIAHFYLELVKKIQGVPRLIRADRGTENSLLRIIHIALRSNDGDSMAGERSFLYGRSVANQRIEAFWSYLTRLCLRFWIDLLKDLRDRGIIDTSNDIHIQCIRFCFADLIQRDLSRVAVMWNQHRIRSQPNAECPSSKPDVLYFLPEAFETRDYKLPLRFSNADIEEVRREYCEQFPKYGCSTVFTDGLSALIGNSVDNYTMPNSAEESTQMLKDLIEIFDWFNLQGTAWWFYFAVTRSKLRCYT